MLEIFSYGFMQRAVLAGLLIGISSALLGVFLLLRRMSLIGDGLSHIAFGGVALGLFLGVMPFEVAIIFSVLSALAIVKLRNWFNVKGDVSIGIVFSFALALGVILLSLSNGFSVDLHYYLFGSIISVSPEDVTLAFAIALVVVAFVFAYKNYLIYTCFDETSARVSDVDVELLSNILIILTAISVVISIRIVGIFLVSSFLIIPPAASLQVARSFKDALMCSILFSSLSIILGLVISYYFNIASGGAIVFVSVLLFLLASLYAKLKK